MKTTLNQSEKEFIKIASIRFDDIFDEVMDSDIFWKQNDWYRFSKTKEALMVYSELLKSEQIKLIIKDMQKKRPTVIKIADDFACFIRNIIIHFPLFESWNEVWISKLIVNWNKKHQRIDKFLEENRGKQFCEFEFMPDTQKQQIYNLKINFPKKYDGKSVIYLKEMIPEKEGVIFLFILMNYVLGKLN